MPDHEQRPTSAEGAQPDDELLPHALTHLRRGVAELETSAASRRVANGIPIAVFVCQDDRLVYASRYAEQLTGYSCDELVGMNLARLVHPDSYELVKGRGQAHGYGAPAPEYSELEIVTKGGDERWLGISSGPAEFEGKPAALAMAWDVTAHRRADQALQQAVASLRAANRRFEALASVGHKLQETLGDDEICRVVVAELSALGLDCALALREGDHLVLRHVSLAPDVLAAAEEAVGKNLIGLALPMAAPILQSVVRERQTRFVEQAASVVAAALAVTVTPRVQEVLQEVRFRQAMFAPLAARGQVIGLLTLWSEALAPEDAVPVSVFANEVAIAIDNARLIESLARRRQQLRSLAARLAQVEEGERRRLAQELHDQVGGNLGLLGINLGIVKAQVSEDAAALHERLDVSRALLEETSERIRHVMSYLHPPALADLGLVAGLRGYCAQFAERTGCRVTVTGEEPVPRLETTVETALFRIAQEALANVAKHAAAKDVRVAVDADDNAVRLTVSDDGVGFDPSLLAEPDAQRGWGFLTMSERAEAVGGHFRVESSPGAGTRVVAEVQR